MPFPEFQQEVARFVELHRLAAAPEARLLDLSSELGELAKEWLKQTEYGTGEFAPTPEWEGELGDTFFALICLAQATGVNLETALTGALQKYKQRMKSGNHPGSGR